MHCVISRLTRWKSHIGCVLSFCFRYIDYFNGLVIYVSVVTCWACFSFGAWAAQQHPSILAMTANPKLQQHYQVTMNWNHPSKEVKFKRRNFRGRRESEHMYRTHVHRHTHTMKNHSWPFFLSLRVFVDRWFLSLCLHSVSCAFTKNWNIDLN